MSSFKASHSHAMLSRELALPPRTRRRPCIRTKPPSHLWRQRSRGKMQSKRHLHTPRSLGEERRNHKRQMRIKEDAPSLASPTHRIRVGAEEVGPPNRGEVAEGADVGVVFVYCELPRIRHFCRGPLAATQPTLPQQVDGVEVLDVVAVEVATRQTKPVRERGRTRRREEDAELGAEDVKRGTSLIQRGLLGHLCQLLRRERHQIQRVILFDSVRRALGRLQLPYHLNEAPRPVPREDVFVVLHARGAWERSARSPRRERRRGSRRRSSHAPTTRHARLQGSEWLGESAISPGADSDEVPQTRWERRGEGRRGVLVPPTARPRIRACARLRRQLPPSTHHEKLCREGHVPRCRGGETIARGSARSSSAAAAAADVEEEAVGRRRGRGTAVASSGMSGGTTGSSPAVVRRRRLAAGRGRRSCRSARGRRGAESSEDDSEACSEEPEDADDEAATSDRVRGRERGRLRGADVEVEAANSPNTKKAKRIARARRQLAILAARTTRDRRGDDKRKDPRDPESGVSSKPVEKQNQIVTHTSRNVQCLHFLMSSLGGGLLLRCVSMGRMKGMQ